MKLLIVTNSLISCKGGAGRVIEKIARHFDATVHVLRHVDDGKADGASCKQS